MFTSHHVFLRDGVTKRVKVHDWGWLHLLSFKKMKMIKERNLYIYISQRKDDLGQRSPEDEFLMLDQLSPLKCS